MPQKTERVILSSRNPGQKNKLGKKNTRVPEVPSPVTVVQVGDLELKVERTVLRYELLEDVLEDLPEFVQDLLYPDV